MATNLSQADLAELLHEAIKYNNYSRVEYLEAEIQAKNPDPVTDFFSDHYITITHKEAASIGYWYDIMAEDAVEAWKKGFLQIYPNSDGGFFWEFKNTNVIDHLRFKKKLATDKWLSLWYKLNPKRYFERKNLRIGKTIVLELGIKLKNRTNIVTAFNELKVGQPKTVQNILNEMINELNETSGLKNTFEKYPTYFPKVHNHLLFGGEGARDLSVSLKEYANAMESDELKENIVI
ncbi:MAG: hypothetical protein NE334_14605 [Lentisphaeraceae bacterium]|nr:hypothetical protein [Lentisphaeraceae bacterium]